ncbi:MAG: FAD-dependent oxidoreductase [Rhodospirillales bacterium]|nr:FAD-dependent oxidoreductase [Rhodospirillales bacterium]
MSARVHIAGAGLSGLSAALRLLQAGRAVTVYEAAGHAGGRCRSYDEPALGRRIDNGNHLVLSGNTEVQSYLSLTGAEGGLAGPPKAEFPFCELATGERWTVRPNDGRIPWWVFSKRRRVPDTQATDYLQGLRFLKAGPLDTVAEILDTRSSLYRRFWEPLTVAVLNTAAEEGAALLMAPVIQQTFGKAGTACRPLIARQGLSETFVQPALDLIDRQGGQVNFNHRLRSVGFDGERVATLDFGDHQIAVGEDEGVILALPPLVTVDLIPGLFVPRRSRAIVNGHFLLPGLLTDISFMGLLGGTAHWLFVRGDVVSVTVSAADDLAEEAADTIAGKLWPDIVAALDLGEMPLPAYRIVKEKRATFAQTPAESALRPNSVTDYDNCFLAGDWTRTGLPATIEGAILSGRRAAASLLSQGPASG